MKTEFKPKPQQHPLNSYWLGNKPGCSLTSDHHIAGFTYDLLLDPQSSSCLCQ